MPEFAPPKVAAPSNGYVAKKVVVQKEEAQEETPLSFTNLNGTKKP